MKILICCGGGFSSSYVAMRMQNEINARHLENQYQVDFLPFSLILEKFEEYDVIFLSNCENNISANSRAARLACI